MDTPELTPDVLVRAYCAGLFPMGDDETGAVRWYAPDPRGVLPLDDFHVPGTLARLVRRERFRVTFDGVFDRVITACADRERTWITPRISWAYRALYRAGAAHSVETWTRAEGDEEETLAGGLYGVALGGAFFGESMFFRETNASKVALVHLVRRLKKRGYRLLDTQYGNAHLEQFGGAEIPRAEYQRRLGCALRADATWGAPEGVPEIAPEAAAKSTFSETDRPGTTSLSRT
jgi:leucyl/phenylalanyl-tRNA--protein transferase